MAGYLLASDFDNTICFWANCGWIYDKDREAIRRFREAGNKFVIVSGRSYPSAIEVFREMGFHDMDFFMVMSGAYAAYPDETKIFDKRINMKNLPVLVDFFKATGGRYLGLDIGKENFSVDIGGDWQPQNTITLEEAMGYPTFTSINVGYHSNEEAYEVAKELEKNYSHIITPLQNNCAIDMPPAGVNKATAVDFARNMFKIERDNVYTTGDNYNDIMMLEEFHGYAMANGPTDVWKHAEGIVSNVCEVIDRIMSLD